MNSALWHFGDNNPTSTPHLRLFAYLELGENGVHIRHVDENGEPAINVFA